MRLSRIISALALGLAVASVPTAAGAAQPYPPQISSLTLSDSIVTAGEVATLFGENFGPNEIVDIAVTAGPLAAGVSGAQTARRATGATVAMVPVARQLPATGGFARTLQAFTDVEGNFQTTFRPKRPGIYTFIATGRESGRTASATLTVLGGRKHLPVTGDGVGPQIAVGSGLLMTGVLLMLLTMAWRRRNRRREEVLEFETVR